MRSIPYRANAARRRRVRTSAVSFSARERFLVAIRSATTAPGSPKFQKGPIHMAIGHEPAPRQRDEHLQEDQTWRSAVEFEPSNNNNRCRTGRREGP